MVPMTSTAARKPNRLMDGPNPVDIHVGARLRLRRTLAGMSQEELGKASGLTFQQIQKYERGINRMGASRLFQLARLLNISVSWFFDELPGTSGSKPLQPGLSDSDQEPLEGVPPNDSQIMQRRETLELIRAYYRIADPKQRRAVYDFVKKMAAKSE